MSSTNFFKVPQMFKNRRPSRVLESADLFKGPADSVYKGNVAAPKGNALLLIDPQNDFMDQPGATLPVPGAVADSIRTASFIMKNLNSIDDIYVSLDSHCRYHIAHSNFWWMKVQKADNPNKLKDWEQVAAQEVPPFTSIPHQSLKMESDYKNANGDYCYFYPRNKQMTTWALEYTAKLESNSNLELFIWPYHCLIGSNGHNIQGDIWHAISQWELLKNRPAGIVLKGHNSKSEHYSCFKAEVEVPDDSNTSFNNKLYTALTKHNRIYVAGQARSHCVNNSVRHLVNKMKEDGKDTAKVCLLEGAMSDVGVEEAKIAGEKFWCDMVQEKCTTSFDIRDIFTPETWVNTEDNTDDLVSKIDSKFAIPLYSKQ